MGVEYCHGLFVADLQWKPKPGHAERIYAVLAEWRLATELPTRHDAVTGADLDPDADVPNLMLAFGTVEGAAVGKVMGPSAYAGQRGAPKVAERCIDMVTAVLGVDLKVPASEEWLLEIREPPRNGRRPVRAQDDMRTVIAHNTVYPASWTTTPPKLEMIGAKLPEGFTGVWRSGILFDCGKDVPAIGAAHAPLPAPGLRKQLEAALEAHLVELGVFC